MHSTNTPTPGHDDSWEWAPMAPPREFIEEHERLAGTSPPGEYTVQEVLAEAMAIKNLGPIKRFDEADRMALVNKLDRAAQKALDLSRALSDIAAAVGQYDLGRDPLASEGDVL